MMVDQTDEESKALVDELYKRDTTGLVGDEGVTIPPPLLTHKFDIKWDSKTHGATTDIYLVASPGWSGRERLLSIKMVSMMMMMMMMMMKQKSL